MGVLASFALIIATTIAGLSGGVLWLGSSAELASPEAVAARVREAGGRSVIGALALAPPAAAEVKSSRPSSVPVARALGGDRVLAIALLAAVPLGWLAALGAWLGRWRNFGIGAALLVCVACGVALRHPDGGPAQAIAALCAAAAGMLIYWRAWRLRRRAERV